MAFPVIGGTQESGYNIDNSLRFNPGDSPYLSRTLGTPTSQRIATFSTWAKFNGQRSGSNDNVFFNFGGDYGSFAVVRTAGTPQIYIDDSDQYYLLFNNGPSLRDPSAWYHLVAQIDTTQSTAANRLKIYINGTQLDNSNASHANYPTQNYDIPGLASGETMRVSKTHLSVHYIDGYTAEMAYVDGSIVAPTVFGETNDNGVWIPRDFKNDVTFGNNGAYLEFKQTGTSQNSSGIGADTSGNDNHFAVNNLAAIDVTTDTPQNNFCTWNSLANYHAGSTFSEGNCYITMADSVSTFNAGTFGLTSGKWYWETKVINIGSGSDNFLVGAVSRPDSGGTTDYLGEPTSVVYRNNGNIKKDSANATHGASYGVNDIVMVALDCDNNNIYFGSNGNWADGSGNNDESSPTSAVAFTSTMINDGIVFPAQGDLHGNTPNPIASTNFGNPPHSISSGNSDANGYGNFEYAVPSGYYALCTKNLAEYG